MTAANDQRKQDAEKELQTIQFIKKQLARPDSVIVPGKERTTLHLARRKAFLRLPL
jgi:hypothetical protein